MKIIVLHGDDSEKSYTRLTKFIKEAKKRNWEIVNDKLDLRKHNEVLLHELSHIPRNFSGALTPHTRRGHNNFKEKLKQMITKLDNL